MGNRTLKCVEVRGGIDSTRFWVVSAVFNYVVISE
jgi:hypothetical protein